MSHSIFPSDHLSSLTHVWRVDDLAREESTTPTGHPMLDACLPGGGWPTGQLVELLQSRPEAHVWQLLLPGLAQALLGTSGPIVLVGAPQLPFMPALQAMGIASSRLLRVQSERPMALAWATEQALRCVDVAAVLAWLPQAEPAQLRRLQVSAQQQRHLLFVMRSVQARTQATPARLRLLLGGQDETMEVHVLKRRGPPMEAPIHLQAWPLRLQALVQSRRRPSILQPMPTMARRSHVLDRTLAIN
jgi:protein ImuA